MSAPKDPVKYVEWRAKISESVKAAMTPEVRAKMSVAKKGKKLSDERRAIISEYLKGNKNTLGYKHTEETKKKISKSVKAAMTPKTREKISLGLKEHLAKNPMTISDETRKKISNTLKKQRWSGHSHRIDGPTKAEEHFALLMPHLKREVVFGTGKNGKKIWGTTWFRADFVDDDDQIIYEIDGSWHDDPRIQERDARKEAFLKSKGYKVIRYTNEDVLSIPLEIKLKRSHYENTKSRA